MSTRRNFLKSAFMAGGALLIADRIIADPYAPIRITNKGNRYPKRVKGKIHSNGGGIPDVSVTDGVTVARTDAEGIYEIITDMAQPFVYLSIPSGYQFPTSDFGTASFYSRLTDSQEEEINFDLTKSPESDTEHNFLLLADPQTLDASDIESFNNESVRDIIEFTKEFRTEKLFGVSCGDIMYDNLELYPEYKSAINRTGIPFFQVLGNHDLDLINKTDDSSAMTFINNFGPNYYSFNRGEIHYVVLDDVFWFGEGYLGYITDKQLNWLKEDLKYIEQGSTVVVFLHIPVYCEIHARHDTEKPRNSVVVTNREILYRILEPYRTYLLSGHTHESEYLTDHGNEIHIGGAVCGAWWTGPICREGTPKGYSIYTVKGSDIRWQYKSTGKELSYQMTNYPPNSEFNKTGAIITNVWSADKNWKVYIYEDGIKRPMERKIGKDPHAVALYEGENKPPRHRWVEPFNTNHLFHSDYNPNLGSMVIEAVDRWGRAYSQKVL